MELLEVVHTPFTRRSRSVVVAHGATGLGRGLEPGEPVLVRDETGAVSSAHVSDLDFDLDDTYYRITVGARLDEAQARRAARSTRNSEQPASTA
ncbi:hypothetical protein [Nocardioides alkalitolerans]|uniref:hypothetical protein n=1 Tax=Nocardioides alkalitolerans TaxID=281714 RepID=UPI00048F3FC8|nr:hypothetical protein [Nocardioides alkalitolerans]